MLDSCSNLLKFGIRDLSRLLRNREITYTQLCNESLKRIDETRCLNSFITVCRDEATKKANMLDEQFSRDNYHKQTQRPINLLHGIPISIKDNFCTKDILTTCGSRMLHNFVPPYSATAVSKLLNTNSVIVGKTNMDEFAMGSSSTTSFFGPSANCWNNRLSYDETPKDTDDPSKWFIAGGSSTGSATSVASGACFVSLGTDTGGSTRQPASLTGIVGFKPSYGLISRSGLVPLAHCLDVVSIFSRSTDDAQIVFGAIVGQDESDLTSVDHKTVLKSKFNNESLLDSDAVDSNKSTKKKTIRIGVPREFIGKSDLSEEVSNFFDRVVNSVSSNNDNNIKFELVNLKLPQSNMATECYTIISCAEIASNMSCYDGVKFGSPFHSLSDSPFDRDEYFRANRDEGFGSEVKKRILLGNYFLLDENREKYLMQAMKLRNIITQEFAKAFAQDEVDFIITPSTPSTSLSFEEWTNKQETNKLFHDDYFMIPSNLANLPSISLPGGQLSPDGLPFGLQLTANKYHDLDLLMVAKVFEDILKRS